MGQNQGSEKIPNSPGARGKPRDLAFTWNPGSRVQGFPPKQESSRASCCSRGQRSVSGLWATGCEVWSQGRRPTGVRACRGAALQGTGRAGCAAGRFTAEMGAGQRWMKGPPTRRPLSALDPRRCCCPLAGAALGQPRPQLMVTHPCVRPCPLWDSAEPLLLVPGVPALESPSSHCTPPHPPAPGPVLLRFLCPFRQTAQHAPPLPTYLRVRGRYSRHLPAPPTDVSAAPGARVAL